MPKNKGPESAQATEAIDQKAAEREKVLQADAAYRKKVREIGRGSHDPRRGIGIFDHDGAGPLDPDYQGPRSIRLLYQYQLRGVVED